MENTYSQTTKDIADVINIISRSEVERIWEITENGGAEKFFFPEDYQKDIRRYFSNDYYIIYLSGVSIFNQMRAESTKSFKFTIGSLNEKIIQETGAPGYYLIKIKRRNLSFISDHNKLMPCPKGWRRANLREACEIMFNILFVDQKKINQRDWHVCPDWENKKKIMRIRFSILNPKEIIIGNISTGRMSLNLNSITIKRL